MKRYYVITSAICLATLLCFSFIYGVWDRADEDEVLKVGFIYENDESTPYTYNFFLAQHALEKEYGERIAVLSMSNVLSGETAEPLRDLARQGCRIIFTDTHSDQVAAVAEEYPQVQFCQVSHGSAANAGGPENYHTFNGTIYQGRYVSGIVAGLKLRELLDSGALRPEQAQVGFVGAFSTPEVISGYTAFLLGVRSVAPEAVMRVRYTNTWSSYSDEKACAEALIREGCVIIAQHTNTIGPAIACEEASGESVVYHVGYHQSVLDVAPSTSLVSTRVNWTPYVTGAVGALLASRPIEKFVDGDVHGHDVCAGFDRGWVEMLELNRHIAAAGTQERVEQAVESFRRGRLEVFKGAYTGVNPDDSGDTIDLRNGFVENSDSSLPSFHYILEDIITIES